MHEFVYKHLNIKFHEESLSEVILRCVFEISENYFLTAITLNYIGKLCGL